MAVPSMRTLQACRSAAAASFDPTSISGCKLWLDASVAGDFTFSSGVVVSQWNDRSGQGNHVSQATTSKQPSRTGTQNGLTVVAFDSTDVMKATPASAFGATAGAGVSTFVVFRKTGSNNSYEALPAQLGYSNSGRPYEGYNAGRICDQSTMAANTGSFPNINTLTSWTCLTTHITLSGSGRPTWREYTNGTLTCTSYELAGSVSSTDQRIVIAARDDETPQFTGDIAEVIMYDTPLGSTDRGDVETYLIDKWGV